MSSNFIGSKIAIITKSQCRYVGTIIGIDALASSIILGNVKCYGTENRGGNFVNNLIVGTIVPIMNFANSDIEDLKIVEDETITENSMMYSMPVQPSPPVPIHPQRQPSIHDDPAIVQAVVSSKKQDLSTANRLVDDLRHLNLSDEQSRNMAKTEESRHRHHQPNSGELNPSWSSVVSSNTGNKFFDGFQSTNSDSTSSKHFQTTWPTYSSSTSHQNDSSGLSIRQPMASNNRSYPQQYPGQQNGYIQQRYNNQNNQRRLMPSNQQRRFAGSNRETFHDNGNNFDDDFDFETSNQKFNKLASEDEFKQQTESSNQFGHQYLDDSGSNTDYEPIYDKKKSFFDSTTAENTSEVSVPMYNRTRNQDTFGYDRNQQQRYRGGSASGNRRGKNQYRQQGNENYSSRQNYNGYNYRH